MLGASNTLPNSICTNSNKERNTLLQQKMHEHLKQVLRIAKVGSWMMDLTTGETDWSEETYRICGIPIEAKLNIDMIWEIIHPEDRELVGKSFMLFLTYFGGAVLTVNGVSFLMPICQTRES
jgi:PAS domain-containing protein